MLETVEIIFNFKIKILQLHFCELECCKLQQTVKVLNFIVLVVVVGWPKKSSPCTKLCVSVCDLHWKSNAEEFLQFRNVWCHFPFYTISVA